jgi:hypothetical protein
MAWSNDRWPPHQGDALDTDYVMNEVRQALAERNRLVPANRLPGGLARWNPLLGTPAGGTPPLRTVANFQSQVQQMLLLPWPLRWWDPNREDLYTFACLCQDVFGRQGWTHDLTAVDEHGNPQNRWTPACAVIFEELYRGINRLDRVRLLPTAAESVRRDSVYRLEFGISDWPQDRAETLALFDGEDDGQTVELAFDVGLGGEVYDSGSMAQWTLESRQFRMAFATAALSGCTIRRGWLDLATAACGGTSDFSDAFTAQVTDAAGNVLGTFASDSYGLRRIKVPASSLRTDGDTEFTIRSGREDVADRPAWSPPGPDYTSTYREGLVVTGPIRLIVEVDFEYHD